jgi:hypothetical protein
MSKSKEIVLLNRWTHLIQGHGQDEVVKVKKFVYEEFGLESKIFCTSKEFGDIHKSPPINFLKLIPIWLKRGWIFRVSLERIRRGIYKAWERYLLEDTNSGFVVVLTSGDFRDVYKLVSISNGKFNVYARVTHYNPEVLTPKEKIEVSRTFESGLLRLGIETQSARDDFKTLRMDLETYWVPPAQGLQDFSIGVDDKDLKIGLIYALTHKPSIESVQNLLERLSTYNVIVRLPNDQSFSFLKVLFPKINFMENGLSLEEFEESLRKVTFAILPHQGYALKGSGLAYYFLAKGVPTLIDEQNSFFGEICQSNLVIPWKDAPTLTDSFLDTALEKRMSISLIEESVRIRRRVEQQWKIFLDGIDLM